jgi:hypothetical protein
MNNVDNITPTAITNAAIDVTFVILLGFILA